MDDSVSYPLMDATNKKKNAPRMTPGLESLFVFVFVFCFLPLWLFRIVFHWSRVPPGLDRVHSNLVIGPPEERERESSSVWYIQYHNKHREGYV